MQRKAETVLKGRFKEPGHLGEMDDLEGEKIRELNLNTKRGSIEGNKGFS